MSHSFILINKSEDGLKESDYECIEKHRFKSFKNDVEKDNFNCPECELSILKSILDKLEIKYTLDNNHIKIDDKNIIIGKNIGKKDNVNVIEIEEFKDNKYLKEKIWDAIKDNLNYIKIGKERKVIPHNCKITKIINQDNDGSSSLYKTAEEPYPFGRKTAIGYVRVSTTMQVNEGASLEAQESDIFRYTENQNYFLKTIFIDKGISGRGTDKRLALQQLLKEVEESTEPLCVIVYSISRMARNTKDLLEMVEKIEKKKGQFLALDMMLDYTSPSGKLVLTFMAGQAQFESETTSERIKNVLRHLKENGKLRSKPPFGWKLNDDRDSDTIFLRNEEEQEKIEQIRQLKNKNPEMGITSFHRLVDETISPTRKSKQWYRPNLKKLMIREGMLKE